jgi:uncharacterized protein
MNDQPPILEEIVASLSARSEVRRVILFGSRARGDAGEKSDIDLAVAAPRATKRQWLEIIRLAEESETLLTLQLVRMEEISEELKNRIEREGKVLYDRSEG